MPWFIAGSISQLSMAGWLAGLCVCRTFDARPPHFLSVVVGVFPLCVSLCLCACMYVFGSVALLVILEKGNQSNMLNLDQLSPLRLIEKKL